tara:strand:- start:296 stop:409 length:114 start_codon:yes stop_codon:yes gene_type:complete
MVGIQPKKCGELRIRQTAAAPVQLSVTPSKMVKYIAA